MARYFAEIDEAGVVLRVIVCDDPDWPAENLGGTWVETKMDDPAEEYAGPGMRLVPGGHGRRFIRPVPPDRPTGEDR